MLVCLPYYSAVFVMAINKSETLVNAIEQKVAQTLHSLIAMARRKCMRRHILVAQIFWLAVCRRDRRRGEPTTANQNIHGDTADGNRGYVSTLKHGILLPI